MSMKRVGIFFVPDLKPGQKMSWAQLVNVWVLGIGAIVLLGALVDKPFQARYRCWKPKGHTGQHSNGQNEIEPSQGPTLIEPESSLDMKASGVEWFLRHNLQMPAHADVIATLRQALLTLQQEKDELQRKREEDEFKYVELWHVTQDHTARLAKAEATIAAVSGETRRAFEAGWRFGAEPDAINTVEDDYRAYLLTQP